VKSCFGSSLEILCKTLSPIASIEPPIEGKLLLAKEIYALTQWILKYGSKKEDIFFMSGKQQQKIFIIQNIDNLIPLEPSLGNLY
jgi:hypothetical protein